jgi:hypothetical protein
MLYHPGGFLAGPDALEPEEGIFALCGGWVHLAAAFVVVQPDRFAQSHRVFLTHCCVV